MTATSSRRQLAQVHPEMPQHLERYLEERGWSWRQLERGELPRSLEEIQFYLINSDPVLFAECNLVERPENGSGRWRLFDFQRQSLRYRGDVVNKSAAGVGKTRELVALILFGLVNRRGGILFIGNQDGTLEEAWVEIEWQRDHNPWLRQQLPDDGIRMKPYRSIRAANGNRLITRPTGDQGEPIRGVHVHQLIVGDEVAKWDRPRIFHEMYRAAEPGCSIRLYSVPDGRRDTEFYAIAAGATPLERMDPSSEADQDSDTTQIRPTAGAELGAERRWALVRWTKPQMPAPYWSPARAADFERRYGGKDTNGYLQNVLGLDGDPEESVWPWPRLRPVLRHLEEYRAVKLTWDGTRGVCDAFVARLSPTFSLAEGDDPAGGAGSPWVVEHRDEHPIADFDPVAFLARYLPPLPPGQYVAGGDLGGSDDPTELFILRATGAGLRCVLRVHLRRWDYPAQARVVEHLHKVNVKPSYGWGFDATGAGAPVEQQIRGLLNNPDDVTGYVWNATRADVHPATGEPVLDDKGRPRTVTHKEAATQLLELDVQGAGIELPLDPDVLREWPSHTSRKLPSGRRAFGKTHDHTIDAVRAARLRYFDLVIGNLTAVPITYAVPQGSRRDSMAILEGF